MSSHVFTNHAESLTSKQVLEPSEPLLRRNKLLRCVCWLLMFVAEHFGAFGKEIVEGFLRTLQGNNTAYQMVQPFSALTPG